jgi:hypothetical protein
MKMVGHHCKLMQVVPGLLLVVEKYLDEEFSHPIRLQQGSFFKIRRSDEVSALAWFHDRGLSWLPWGLKPDSNGPGFNAGLKSCSTLSHTLSHITDNAMANGTKRTE